MTTNHLSLPSLFELATTAAQKAGTLLREPLETITIRQKSSIDLVTQYDCLSEEIICEILYPSGISILAEEQGLMYSSETNARWIIDPLDGTTNFSHHVPHYCVSIALEVENRLELAVIFDPNRNELYTAQRGRGAFLNGVRIHTSPTSSIQESLLLTGFGYDRQHNSDFYLHYFSHFLQQARGIRRGGSAALDLAWVSAGRGDGFWEFNLKPWDVAAGILLVQEAGGQVSSLYPQSPLLNGNIVACTQEIADDLDRSFQILHRSFTSNLTLPS